MKLISELNGLDELGRFPETCGVFGDIMNSSELLKVIKFNEHHYRSLYIDGCESHGGAEWWL